MDYKVYILIKHASKTITFYKTFDAILSDINIRFIHTFIFDFEYYETHKLTKNEKSYCLKFKKFDILEFNINNEEELLEWEKTMFSKHQEANVILEPYKKLWETASLFQTEYSKWMNGNFKDLVAEQVEESVNSMFRIMFKLSKTFLNFELI